MNRVDIMIDIESLGTDSRYPMIQLGAASFDVNTFTPIDVFCRNIRLEKNTTICSDTLNWWMMDEDRREVFSDIITKNQPANVVMNDFLTWIPNNSKVFLWAKPTSFDMPFVFSYLRQYCEPEFITMKLSRRRIIDVRSFLLGSGVDFDKIKSYKIDPNEFQKWNLDAKVFKDHNAGYDCLEQIWSIKKNLERAQNTTLTAT